MFNGIANIYLLKDKWEKGSETDPNRMNADLTEVTQEEK